MLMTDWGTNNYINDELWGDVIKKGGTIILENKNMEDRRGDWSYLRCLYSLERVRDNARYIC